MNINNTIISFRFITGSLLIIFSSVLLGACGGGDSAPATAAPANSSNWDELQWDQNNWQ